MPRCSYELCRSLVGFGVDVTVWTTDALDAEHTMSEPEAKVDGIAVRYFPNLSNSLAYHRQLYLPVGFWSYARRHIGEFDLVHIHSHRHALEVIASAAARSAGRPYVFTANGTSPPIERYVMVKQILDVLGARRVLQHAAACIAVSDFEVGHYLAAGVDASRIHVIPNGIRPQDYEHLPARGEFRRSRGIGDGPLVLFVGKITPRKGVDVLIRSLALLHDSVQLVIAGNFMMPEEPIRHLVRELELAHRIHFPGLLLADERNGAYVDADVVAYPSVDEIFGLVPAEALMCGAPVVVCDDSGCGAYVGAADAGLLVRYGDPHDLAGALETLLKNTARRRQCVESGRRYVEEYLRWERIAERTLELYRVVREENPLSALRSPF